MDDQDNSTDTTITQFITEQNQMNATTRLFMEQQSKMMAERDEQQAKTMLILNKLLERDETEPAKKKARKETPVLEETLQGSSTQLNTVEAASGSKSGKGKKDKDLGLEDILTSHEPDITVHVSEHDASLLQEEIELYNQLQNPRNDTNAADEGKENNSPVLEEMTEEQLEEFLSSEYKDLLSQTEEKTGPPVSQAAAAICERYWAKALLSAEKKKELWDGLDIPINCKPLKAPKLNTNVYIRIGENVQTKDYGAQARQRGLTRAVIPLLYSMGEMDKMKASIEAQQKILNYEPRDLEEAKKMLKVVATRSEALKQNVVTSRAKIHKSFTLLNYSFTETTRKRKQDVTTQMGLAFKPFGIEVTPPSEYLFDEDTMKRMKPFLKDLKPRAKYETKNESSFTKTRRSGGFQGNQNNFQKNFQNKNFSGNNSRGSNNNNNNGNKNYNSNNNNHGGKKQYPSRKR